MPKNVGNATIKTTDIQSDNLPEQVCEGKNLSGSRCEHTDGKVRKDAFNMSQNRPNTSLVRFYVPILVPSTDDLNGLSRGHHVAT